MSLSWRGADYSSVTHVIHEAWGEKLIDELGLRPDEDVLDAGCGSGELTARILERVGKGRGRLLGVDSSPSMLEQARRKLAADPRVTWLEADLVTAAWPFQVDAIFSSATFHWVADHAALFKNLRRALKPGGRMRAQCGGEGNIARIHAAVRRAIVRAGLSDTLERWRPVSHFASVSDTERRLAEAGFVRARVWLEASPTPVFPDAAAFVAFTRAVNLVQVLSRLKGPADQDALVAAFLEEIQTDGKGLYVDYVRLNIACEG